MEKQRHEKTIRLWLDRIEKPPLSTKEYLSRHNVPFGLTQYYAYRRKLKEGGIEALRDGRAKGNHRRVNAEVEGFLHGYVTAHPEGEMELPVLCYYVDGNTKALRSKKHVKQSKVTTLGARHGLSGAGVCA